jgi:hypothetical protein
MHPLKQTVAAFSLLASLCVPALPGLAEDAISAYSKGDYATAATLWRQLADQGDVTAQYRVGIMYNNGEGVPQSYAEAARWFRLAAEQGDPKAQFLLGFLYAAGNGVALNDTEAARWFPARGRPGRGESAVSAGIRLCGGSRIAAGLRQRPDVVRTRSGAERAECTKGAGLERATYDTCPDRRCQKARANMEADEPSIARQLDVVSARLFTSATERRWQL